ncbi:MAG TPA: hypothetical protein DCZ95_17930 [Verrucomicrobia bacterium]|nr:MAG: hypothetical protein A2X46_10705 [Lentisphaerae bacterium GWF2_57_35]HBA85967.1 hypothetical protein [Verrucomicrobiota bacterium]
MAVGLSQIHNFHSSNDEDWVRFFAASGWVFHIEAEQLETNVDVRLEVYYEEFDGSLSNLSYLACDHFGKGTGVIEATSLNFATFTNLTAGFYCVKVDSGDAAAWGPDSLYKLHIYIPSGGRLIVDARDWLNGGASVMGAELWMGGELIEPFSGRTDISVNMPESSCLVEVRVPPLYRPVEDRYLPNQAANPYSSIGNPRWVQPGEAFASFQFSPCVEASGQLRDEWTGAPLGDAKLTFITRLGGWRPHTEIKGYPPFASYQQAWYTDQNGHFPSNVILPAVHYDLVVGKTRYPTGLFESVLSAYTGCLTTNVGVLRLRPGDIDGNGLADDWQGDCFGTNSIVAADEDPDHDGFSNRQEYFLGTDPTNPASFFSCLSAAPEATVDGMVLTWPTRPGRVYSIKLCGELALGIWSTWAGPWTADVQTASMSWTSRLAAADSLYYGVEASTSD